MGFGNGGWVAVVVVFRWLLSCSGVGQCGLLLLFLLLLPGHWRDEGKREKQSNLSSESGERK